MKIIEDTYYLSEPGNLARFLKSTDLCKDEVECIVGRFAKHSRRAGRLRGEVMEYIDGSKAR